MNIALIILLVVPFVCLWAGWKLGFRKGFDDGIKNAFPVSAYPYFDDAVCRLALYTGEPEEQIIHRLMNVTTKEIVKEQIKQIKQEKSE